MIGFKGRRKHKYYIGDVVKTTYCSYALITRLIYVNDEPKYGINWPWGKITEIDEESILYLQEPSDLRKLGE